MKNNSGTADAIVAVVPAAGIGSRMQAECPKQYLTLGSCSILEHSIAALLHHPWVSRVVVVLHPQDRYFHTLPVSHHPAVSTVVGGDERADSVLAGLISIHEAEWVLVHDAARPCLHAEDLDRLIRDGRASEVGAILAAPVRDTMKRSERSDNTISQTVERDNLWHALTPQFFPLALLKSCLQRALAEGAVVTDEASALEYCGYHPLLVPGRADNIKVTRPEDLALAEFYLIRQQGKE